MTDPIYKLTKDAYINDKLLKKGQDIVYNGVPGDHMTPVNKEAKAVVKKHKEGKQQDQDTSKLTDEEKRMIDPNDQPIVREAYAVKGEKPANYVPDTQFDPSAPTHPVVSTAPVLADGQTRINGMDTDEEVLAAFPGLEDGVSDESKAKIKAKADADAAAQKKADHDVAATPATPVVNDSKPAAK